MHGDPRILPVSSVLPDPLIMETAATALSRGGMVIFPAQCMYGLAVDALNTRAVSRIFQTKARPRTNPVLVLIKDFSDLHQLAAAVPGAARALMDHFWPGDITLVLEAAGTLPEMLTAGTGKIGIRLPRHPVARALVAAAGTPVTGTSANISGQGGCTRIDDLDARLVERVDMILDAGELKGGMGSTVVDVTRTPPVILRQGSAAASEIFQCVSGLC